jgi:ParB family chromosome partitioning protein
MWDILRFLKTPDGDLNRDDTARTNAEAEKKAIGSQLAESLADPGPDEGQDAAGHDGAASLALEVESARVRSQVSPMAVQGEAKAASPKKAPPDAQQSSPKQASQRPVVPEEPQADTLEPTAAAAPKADSGSAGTEKRPVSGKNARQPGERLLRLPLSDIKPNPFQPRKAMGENEMTELSESIKELGVLQPILVKQVESGYELVAGERRLRAAQRAGLGEIPAVLIETEPLTQQIIALVENIQRKNLSAIEEAVCLQDIQQKTGWTQTELSRRMGRSQASIANKLRLLRLDPSVQELVIAGKLGERQARSLLSLSVDEQKLLAQKAVDEDLSARALETLAENWNDRQSPAKRAEKKKQPSSDGPAGELLGDLASLVNRHRNNGVSAQWRVTQMNQSSLVVEISVDLLESAVTEKAED